MNQTVANLSLCGDKNLHHTNNEKIQRSKEEIHVRWKRRRPTSKVFGANYTSPVEERSSHPLPPPDFQRWILVKNVRENYFAVGLNQRTVAKQQGQRFNSSLNAPWPCTTTANCSRLLIFYDSFYEYHSGTVPAAPVSFHPAAQRTTAERTSSELHK